MNPAEPTAPPHDVSAPAEEAPPATAAPIATEATVAAARPWIPLLFLLSGGVGLMYEVLWSKYLAFVLGSAAYANALVLATFLGGLAAGSALLGRYADKVPNQLYLYAWLELGVALLAGLTPSGFTSLEVTAGGGGLAAKAGLAALVLLPPTILMGGTLPSLSRFLTREVAGVQGQVARLYFLNSTGAVFGALLAGFWLVPRFGLDGATYVGAFTNVAIGLLAMHLSKQGAILAEAPADANAEDPAAAEGPAAAAAEAAMPAPPAGVELAPAPAPVAAEAAVAAEADPEDEAPIATGLRAYALAAVFVSGFVALAYEVAWIRLLALVLGSSTYSFTLMLAAFVAGIAIGSFLVERGHVLGRTPLGRFALAELGVALGVLVTLPLYERLPYWFLGFKGMLAATPQAFWLFEAGKFGFCFALMLVPTVFLGMTLPLATQLVTARRAEVGAKVGEVFAANTLGNVAGAALATLWLLPLLGIKGLIDLGVLINLLVAAGAGFLLPGWPAVRKAMAVGLPFVVFGAQRAIVPGFDMQVLASGVFRESTKDPAASWQDFKRRYADRKVLFNRDDANTTVTVSQVDGNVFLSLNGKVDASSEGDLATQILSAQLPVLMRPHSKDVLVIGFGSGITAGSALSHPIGRLDLAEISPGVLEAGRYFAPFNHDVQKDGRFHPILEDGLSVLRQPGKPYDVIITEPSNSWMAGVGNLFTVDAYAMMARRLAKDGLVVQWLPLYETDDETLGLILRSFMAVFPHATLWQTQAMDTVIVGSRAPIAPDLAALARRAAEPAVAAELRRVGLDRPGALLMLQIGTPTSLADVAHVGDLNTLRWPRLEYRAPIAFYADETAKRPYQLDARLGAGAAADEGLLLRRWTAKHPLAADDFAAYAAYQAESLPLNAFKGVDARVLREWRRAFPGDVRATVAEARRLAEKGQVAEAAALVAPLRAARPQDPALARFEAALLYTDAVTGWGWVTAKPPSATAAIAAHERLLKLPGVDPADAWTRLAALRHTVGDRPGEYAAAAQAIAAIDRRKGPGGDATKTGLLVAVASTALSAGDMPRARGYLEAAYAIAPGDPALRKVIDRYEAMAASAGTGKAP